MLRNGVPASHFYPYTHHSMWEVIKFGVLGGKLQQNLSTFTWTYWKVEHTRSGILIKALFLPFNPFQRCLLRCQFSFCRHSCKVQISRFSHDLCSVFYASSNHKYSSCWSNNNFGHIFQYLSWNLTFLWVFFAPNIYPPDAMADCFCREKQASSHKQWQVRGVWRRNFWKKMKAARTVKIISDNLDVIYI